MNLLMAMTHARLVADDLTAAYYLTLGRREQTDSILLHAVKLAAADDQLAKLAALRGYRLEKIEANPAQSIAA